MGVIGSAGNAGGSPALFRVYLTIPGRDARKRLTAALEAGGWTQVERHRPFQGGFSEALPRGAQRVPDQFQSPDGQSTAHLSEAAPGEINLFIRHFPLGSPQLAAQHLHQQFSLPQLTSTPQVQVTPGGLSGGGDGHHYRIIMTGTLRSELTAAEVAAQLGGQLEVGGWQRAETVGGQLAALHTYQISAGAYRGLGWLSVTRSPEGSSYLGTCGAELQLAAEIPSVGSTTLQGGPG